MYINTIVERIKTMIKLNGTRVDLNHFPDGTMLLKQDLTAPNSCPNNENQICWYYENDREFLGVIYLVKHLRAHGADKVHLYMPYIPNARQDRVKHPEDVFTLKYFAEILNSLNLTSVTVLDPHSSVSEALIDHLVIMNPKVFINQALHKISGKSSFTYDSLSESLTIFYPDEGAMKRYSGMIPMPYTFGIKQRDWASGKITGLEVSGDVNSIAGKDILIIDDICSFGGTFYHSAKKLKELGANKIYLYVSHCENSILNGQLLTSGLIERVFTTNSIFTESHERIEVLV